MEKERGGGEGRRERGEEERGEGEGERRGGEEIGREGRIRDERKEKRRRIQHRGSCLPWLSRVIDGHEVSPHRMGAARMAALPYHFCTIKRM